MKNLLFTHIMYYKANHKLVLCFQRAPYRNCNVQVPCFQRGPQQQLQFEGVCFHRGPQQQLKCVSTLLLNFIEGASKKLQCVSTLLAKEPPTATVMCNQLASKGAPNSNYNVKFHA